MEVEKCAAQMFEYLRALTGNNSYDFDHKMIEMIIDLYMDIINLFGNTENRNKG